MIYKWQKEDRSSNWNQEKGGEVLNTKLLPGSLCLMKDASIFLDYFPSDYCRNQEIIVNT